MAGKIGIFALALAAQCVAQPLDLGLRMNGGVRVGRHRSDLRVMVHHEGWRGFSTGLRTDATPPDAATGSAWFELFDGNVQSGHGHATLLPTSNRRAIYTVTLTSERDQKPAALVLALSVPSRTYAGGFWKDGKGRKGRLPENFANMSLHNGDSTSMTLAAADNGEQVTLTFPVSTRLQIQDDRRWNEQFTLRIFSDGAPAFRKGDQRTFTCIISAPDGVNVTTEQLVAIAPGPDWVPLDYRKDIVAGSALDFSQMGLQDAPAGKYGWLRNVGGHFEFEKRPGVPQRFYGVNLCFTANFPDRVLADRLVTRLVRLGYNTVRIHHYESANGVIHKSKDRLSIDENNARKLDYLLARAYENGIYATTDLYTTRPVLWRDIGLDRDGEIPKQVYKNLIGVHEPAFENWKTFARNFLGRVNSCTGRRYADEPGLPLISLINEGHLMWCWNDVRGLAPMKAAWKKWLDAKRTAEPDFVKGLPDDSESISPNLPNAPLGQFMADVEADRARRQRAFLASLGVKALLTSQNCGPHSAPMMAMREACYDYVDDHFYVDHPRFLGRKWSLPSSCPNKNPVFASYLPPVAAAFTRMPSKPFCITEWNFSGPGMYRGVGGIMTGAMGALQNWDGLWRFAYSHNQTNLEDGSGVPGYFDVASDPLGQASDRASVCLFLRGDMPPLADRLALAVTPDALRPGKGQGSVSVGANWRNAAWQTQVATSVSPAPGFKTFPLAKFRSQKDPPVPLADNPHLAFDRTHGSFRIATPLTAGGFTPSGACIAGPVSFDVGEVPATVWASSLDGQPIERASRLLVTHLTDVQADGNVYDDEAKTVLLKWGTRPLVRDGSAEISLARDAAAPAVTVWALDTSGRRLEQVPSALKDGRLMFTAAVRGPRGARMLYEIGL